MSQHSSRLGSKKELRSNLSESWQSNSPPTPETVEAVEGVGTHHLQAVSDEEVRTLAYAKWEAAGCPEGDGKEFWSEAERELRT